MALFQVLGRVQLAHISVVLFDLLKELRHITFWYIIALITALLISMEQQLTYASVVLLGAVNLPTLIIALALERFHQKQVKQTILGSLLALLRVRLFQIACGQKTWDNIKW